jgi:signal transduction histidine kinase
MVAADSSSTIRAPRLQGPAGAWPRWYALAAVAAPLLLAALAVPVYRAWGLGPAVAVLAGGSLLVIVVLLLSCGRRLRRGSDRVRLVEHALDAVPQALFIVDGLVGGQTNRYVNPAYAALTGYGANLAVSDGFDALAIFADPASVAALDDAQDFTAPAPVTLVRRDGARLAATLALRSVPRSDGNRSLIGLLEPVEHGEQPAERRAPTQGETLEVDAASAVRAKDSFLSALSHDLRSPLNACVMWLDVLAVAPQPDKVAQAVDAIKRNLARQTRLVNDLNDAAKISSSRLDVNLEPLDLVPLIQQQIDAWQLLAIGKQLAFQHHVEPASAPVEADAARLTQALNHLVENSVNSTPAGGRIEVRVRNVGDACSIEIEDSGTSLSAEDAANLGTPLWRAPASAKTRPGLGLGLAVAHHLVERHGGTLTAASRPVGVVFTLALPIADAPR